MRADDGLREALAEVALAHAEHLGGAFKRVAALADIPDRERNHHAHAARPVATHQVGVVPVFGVEDDARQHPRFEPRLHALVVVGEGTVEIVVADEEPQFEILVEARHEEADLSVQAGQRALVLLEGALRPRVDVALRDGAPVAEGERASAVVAGAAEALRLIHVALGDVEVHAGIDPARQHLGTDAELVEVVPVLALDPVVEDIRAHDDLLPRHQIAQAQAVAAEHLGVIVQRRLRAQEHDEIAGCPERRDAIEEHAGEVRAELRAERVGPVGELVFLGGHHLPLVVLDRHAGVGG